MLPASPASFVGRERERERRRVARLWGRSRIVLVLGAGGIGKSALMRRLAEELGGESPVAGHRCSSAAPLLQGLEIALRLPPLATSTQDRVLRLAETLDAQRGVLCVDDLHELEAPELASLLAVASLLRSGRLIATSRRRIALGELEASATIVELGPLSRGEAEALVAELLDRVGREADAAVLAQRAAGSPLWCRLLAGGADRVSEELEGLLTGLPPAARGALERLAAFREPIAPGWLGDGELDEALVRDLEARFLIERAAPSQRPGEARASLVVHDFVRDVVLAGLGPERRRALHGACAAVYERIGPAGFAARLHHLEEGGDRAGLERALHEGGAAWLWAHRRLDECVRLVDVALAGSDRPAPRLRLRQAICLAVQGALGDARRAFERAGEPSPDDLFLRDLAELTLLQEEGERAATRQARYQRLFASAGPGAEPADLGQLANSYVRDCLVQGNLAQAFSVYAELERAPARIDELSRTRIGRRLGDFLSEQGDGAGAARALESAEQSAARLQSPQLSAATHNCWVEHHVRYGDLAAAEAHLARADALPVPSGQTDTSAIRELRRAQLLAARGWLGRATAALTACLAQGALAASTRSSLLAALAATLAQRGELTEARSAARRVLAVPRAQRPSVAQLDALVALARVEIAAGRFTRARRLAAAMSESAWRGTLHERATVGLLLRADATVRLPGPVETRRDEALALVTTALALAEAMRARPLIAAAHLARGAIVKGSAEARADAQRCSAIARDVGAHLLAARAELSLAWCDLQDGDDEAAARHHGAARTAARAFDARAFDAEVERIGMALRARGGSRKARADLEALGAGSSNSALEAREAMDLVSRPPSQIVTRAGRHRASAREAAPEAHDLWMDAASGAVVVGGARRVDLGSRPLLRRLLEVILAAPAEAMTKERLFTEAWRLAYRPARDATLHKAVDRLARLLHPGDPHRFAGWNEDGRLALDAPRPCLVLRDAEAVLNDRQRWVLQELERRPAVSNRDLRAALGVPRATAQRDLEHLVTLGLLRRDGKGRATTYRR